MADLAAFDNDEEVKHHVGCSYYLFGLIPVGGDGSVATSAERLLRSPGSDRLAYLTVDIESTFYVILSTACTRVTAVFATPLTPPRAVGSRAARGPSTPIDEQAHLAEAPRGRAPTVEAAPATTAIALGTTTGGEADKTLRRWIGSRVRVVSKDGSITEGRLARVASGSAVIVTDSGAYVSVVLFDANEALLLEP